MRAVVITVRHSLSLVCPSSKFFFYLRTRFGDYARSHVCDEKSSRRTPPRASPWPHCQWEVLSVFADSQPINGLFGLILRQLHVGYRAARGRWSCSTVLQWMALEVEQHGCERHGLVTWCRNFHFLWRCWVGLDGGCCCGSKMAVPGGSVWRAGAVRRACCA